MNNPLRGSLPHSIHNIAMDLEINEFIEELPKGGFKAKDFRLPERKSYEEYLGLINRDMPPRVRELLKHPEMLIDDIQLDGLADNADNDGNADNSDIYEAILADLISECEKYAGNDSFSSNIRRNIKKRKYRWEQVFQNIITSKVTEIIAGYRYRTFEKTNRRYAHFSDIILPQFFDRKSKISITVIMDISGSMGDNVNKMYGLMKSMVDILDLQIEITVLEVNMDVENVMIGFDLNKKSIKSQDGGGTDMGAGLHYIQDNKMNPDLIIVMTDSYTPWPDPPILADKTVVLTDNPNEYNGPYPMYPVLFE
jgi:predicted metal-dependent peptidase